MQDLFTQGYPPPPPQSVIKDRTPNNASNNGEIELPTHITSNLKNELRNYQKQAINNYLEKRQSNPFQKHFMFEMATGSGKTLNEVQNAFKKFSFPQEKVDDFLTFINHENRGEKYPLEDTWNSNKWDKLNSIAIDSSVSRVDETIAIDDENFKGQKPEALISRILEVSTQENDLVLDFFAGSGTTCAVAHKMKRRYIGIEQMDYIETITKERLKKVIGGEQGGISKKCDFKGGGSFVYAELKEVNLEVKKQILNAKSKSECLKIFNDLSERFLKRADCKIGEIHSEEFQNLDLNEQKRICCTLLDSNEDYLNLGDIDEDAWGIDGITKKYNEIFYS
ncbi:DNA methyltransferase [Helicobacter pylori]|uniref:DNA methyltransferase n=1 Tax=Helicobacter pylori TaxID=210 RepID=UPI00189E02BD|nr:DNA methyltransferase [Helicobacter pylori]